LNAINNLALITGKIGKAGASPFSITGQCNAMGAREAGFASGLLGYRKFESASDRADLAQIWNIPEERIPTSRGLAYPDIIEAAVAGKIRALWILGTNPLVSFPNVDVLKHAFGNLDFLVVQDGFHPTPTTELAHLVLPAAIWDEKKAHTRIRSVASVKLMLLWRHRVRHAPIFISSFPWPRSLDAETNSSPAGAALLMPLRIGDGSLQIDYATTPV